MINIKLFKYVKGRLNYKATQRRKGQLEGLMTVNEI